jgi:hypothetical protein
MSTLAAGAATGTDWAPIITEIAAIAGTLIAAVAVILTVVVIQGNAQRERTTTLSTRITEQEKYLGQRIETSSTQLNGRLDEQGIRLSSRLDEQAIQLNGRIADLTAAMDQLTRRVDGMADNLSGLAFQVGRIAGRSVEPP